MRNIESDKYKRHLPLAEMQFVTKDFQDTISDVYVAARHLVEDVGFKDPLLNNRTSHQVEISVNTHMYYRLVELHRDDLTCIGLQRINHKTPTQSRIVMQLYKDKIVDWEGKHLMPSSRGKLLLDDVVDIVGQIYSEFCPSTLDEYTEFTS